MKKTNKKGFTLIELLTVIAILAVILLIAAPTILGVLDKARKNTFKNQVLLYVEALKSQTALASMGGAGAYSELQEKIGATNFYAPTSDSVDKIVRVSIADLNKVMDNQVLASDTDKYLYVQWTSTGYNYYIGEGVNTTGGYKTSCVDSSGAAFTTTSGKACDNLSYTLAGESVEGDHKAINSKIFTTDHILRNDAN